MILSEYGKIVESAIIKFPEYNKRIRLDEWIIIADHIHFIITLAEYNFDNGILSIGHNNDDRNKIDDKFNEY